MSSLSRTPELSYRILQNKRNFARAYLAAKSRDIRGRVTVAIVYDLDDNPIEFGPASTWAPGVAARVLGGDLKVEYFEQNTQNPSQFIDDRRSSDYDIQPPVFMRCTSVDLPVIVETDCERNPNSSWIPSDERFMQNLVYGLQYSKGRRAQMEDEHTVILDFHKLVLQRIPDYDRKQMYFGLFDGHSGRAAAEFCRDRMQHHIAECIEKDTDICKSIHDGYLACDREFMSYAEANSIDSGAVAVTVLFNGKQMYIANCGDCKAVLSRAGNARDLTVCHTLEQNQHERSRIQNAGGFVRGCRLNGELAVSRAIGDRDRNTGKKMCGLTAIPHVQHFHIKDEDEFLIIACDGLWDVFSPEGAVACTRLWLQRTNDCTQTADALVTECLNRNSSDNISVIVIGFTKVDERSQTRKIILPGGRYLPESDSDDLARRPRLNLKSLDVLKKALQQT